MNSFRSMLANVEDFPKAAATRYGEVYLAQAKHHLPDTKCKTGRRGMYLL